MLAKARWPSALVLAGAVACTAHYPCLSGRIGSNYDDAEDLQLLQREFERARHAEPTVRARVLEALPRLFPDHSDRVDAPECAPEMVDELEAELTRRPLPFNNATFHYLGALGNVGDTSDVMPRKATILLDLATISDSRVRAYERTAGESGPSPDAATLRRRATAELIVSNLYLNDERVSEFLLQKSLAATTSSEQLDLFSATNNVTWYPRSNPLASTLLQRWLRDARAALDAPADPAGFELLLSQLGLLAGLDRVASDLRPVLERIVAADGVLPITRGRSDWARDLAVHARMCLWDLEDTQRAFGSGFMDVPYPSRVPTSPLAGAFDDPTRIRWTEARVAGRLRALGTEFRNLRSESLRCWALHERAAWTPLEQKGALLESWLKSDRVPDCAVGEALGADEMSSALRESLVIQLIQGEQRASAAERILRSGSAARADVARGTRSQHLDWFAKSEPLRALLAADALAEKAWNRPSTMEGLGEARLRFAYQRALTESVSLDTKAGGAERDRARAVVAHWIELVRAADRSSFRDFYTSQLYRALLYTVAELSPKLELAPEVTELLESDDRDHELARWLFLQGGGVLDATE